MSFKCENNHLELMTLIPSRSLISFIAYYFNLFYYAYWYDKTSCSSIEVKD